MQRLEERDCWNCLSKSEERRVIAAMLPMGILCFVSMQAKGMQRATCNAPAMQHDYMQPPSASHHLVVH